MRIVVLKSVHTLLGAVCWLLVISVPATSVAQAPATPMPRVSEEAGSQVGQLLLQVVEQKLMECHFVVLGEANGQKGIMPTLLRTLTNGGFLSQTVVDTTRLAESMQYMDLLKNDLRTIDALNCRAFVIDVTPTESKLMFSFLEEIELYKKPETYVILVGPADRAYEVLSHFVFRNAANILYLGYQTHSGGKEVDTSRALSTDGSENRFLGRRRSLVPLFVGGNSTGIDQRIVLYTRCFYCQDGGPSTYILDRWTVRGGFTQSAELFPDQFKTFYGHKFNIVAMNWFPFTKFIQHSKEGGTVVTPEDSLDIRMVNAIAEVLNFTYEMRTPWDNQWGTSTPSGNWTGIVGTLQYHKADFSMMLSWMEHRLPIVDYSRIYASEPLVMVTSKPKPLPQAFALVRPFAPSLWVITVVSTVVAGLVLWILQLAWSKASHGKRISFEDATLMTWRILLEDPPVETPTNVTAQMLIGWWWVYCMLITITYRSSLVAHLTVPGKSPTLDSLDELLAAHRKNSWTWGYEPLYGSGWEWLKINENPTVKEIFESIQVLELEEQLSRVLNSRHAFITWKYYIRSIIGSQYTNDRGYTPIYTGRQDFFNYGGYGWGFRKGAPFRRRFDQIKQRLIESGSIPFWMDDLIETSSRRARAENKRKREEEGKLEEVNQETGQQTSSLIVLGLGHMQGVFFVLIMGLGFSSLIFLGEILVGRFCKTEHQSY